MNDDKQILKELADVLGLEVSETQSSRGETVSVVTLDSKDVDAWIVATNDAGINVDFNIKTSPGQPTNCDDGHNVALSRDQLQAVISMLNSVKKSKQVPKTS